MTDYSCVKSRELRRFANALCRYDNQVVHTFIRKRVIPVGIVPCEHRFSAIKRPANLYEQSNVDRNEGIATVTTS